MQASGTEFEVCKDIEARQRLGINKYGRTVAEQDYKLVEWLEHAYHEALDQAIYLKRSIEEIQATASRSAGANRPKAECVSAACSAAGDSESLPRSADRVLLAELVSLVEVQLELLKSSGPKGFSLVTQLVVLGSILTRLKEFDLGQVAKPLSTESTEKQR